MKHANSHVHIDGVDELTSHEMRGEVNVGRFEAVSLPVEEDRRR